MENQKTESDILWDDLKELTNDLESGKLSFEEAIATINTLSAFYQDKEVPMFKLTQITKSDCDPVRKALNEAISPVLEQFGLEGGFRNCNFDTQSMAFSKIELSLVGGLTRKEKQEQDNLEFWLAHSEGLDKKALDAVYTIQDGSKRINVKFIGMSSRSGSKPFRFVEVATNDRYSCGEAMVLKTIRGAFNAVPS